MFALPNLELNHTVQEELLSELVSAGPAQDSQGLILGRKEERRRGGGMQEKDRVWEMRT